MTGPDDRGEGVASRLALAPPKGMRDLLPPASTARARLREKLVHAFRLFGYERVTTPPFEHAEVLERGIETVDPRELMRFVEPDTGEVALLRPDLTPQIARIIATRLANRPPPWRLCYEGTVIRRRHGRARQQRQIFQAGVECVGLEGPRADAEVVRVAATACARVGLPEHHFELAQVRLGQAALAAVPEAARPLAQEAMSRKDGFALEGVLRNAGVPAPARRAPLKLIELFGDRQTIGRARRAFRDAASQEALDELEAVVDRLEGAGLGERLGIDLGEVRGQAYYTGVSVTLLAPGPGAAIGTGGRYDRLLGRFGAPAPATGFAFDVDNLEWALRHAGVETTGRTNPRFVLVAADADLEAEALARALRAKGYATSRVFGPGTDAGIAYAKAWDYDIVIARERRGWQATRVGGDAASAHLEGGDAELLGRLLEWADAAHATKELACPQ